MGKLIHFTPDRLADLHLALDIYLDEKCKEGKEKYQDLYKWISKTYKNCEKMRERGEKENIPAEFASIDKTRFEMIRSELRKYMIKPSIYAVIAERYPVFILDLPNGVKMRIKSSKDKIKDIILIAFGRGDNPFYE